MKTRVFVTVILMIGVITASCEFDYSEVNPSKNSTITNLDLLGIKNFDVSDIFKVYISFSDTEETDFIKANENIDSLKYIV